MNESQFEDFLADAVEAVNAKNHLLRQGFGIGHFARWDYDGRRGELTFSNPGDAEVVVAETTSLGTYSLETETWLWAWANNSLPERVRERAEPLKRLSDRTGMRIFADPHSGCDEYLAWELAAASVQHVDGLGCYRGLTRHLWAFWSIDTVTCARRPDQKST